jgi:hypothetical protein
VKDKNYITKDIYYFNNVLPIGFIDNLYYKVLNDMSWAMHQSSDQDSNFFWALNLEDNYSNETEFLSQYIEGNKPLRFYVNGQSGLQHGNFHQDDGERTYLLGLSKDWLSVDQGGATEFLIKDDVTFSVYPTYNRMVSFPSNIPHRALPNIKYESFRMTLAIKTIA